MNMMHMFKWETYMQYHGNEIKCEYSIICDKVKNKSKIKIQWFSEKSKMPKLFEVRIFILNVLFAIIKHYKTVDIMKNERRLKKK